MAGVLRRVASETGYSLLFWFLVLVSLYKLSVLFSSSIGTIKSYQPTSLHKSLLPLYFSKCPFHKSLASCVTGWNAQSVLEHP